MTSVARHPSIAMPLARLRGEGELVGQGTELLIESFPRCASSFALAAFNLAQRPRIVRVAHQTHAAGHVIEAVRRRVPALVLIREPEDVVVSNMIRHPERTVPDLLRGYLRFYEPLLPHRDGFVVATFGEVVGRHMDEVIRRINERFGTSFVEFEATEENVATCLREIDEHWRQRFGDGGRLERIVPRPSELREGMKDELHARYAATAPPTLRARAERIFEALAGPRAGGRVIGGTPILGVELHEVVSNAELGAILGSLLDGDRTARVFTPNPEILLRARRDPSYARVLNSADLALPDGTGLAMVLAARERRIVRRWPGIELAERLMRLAAERGERVAFLGSTPDVAERAVERWRTLLPSLDACVVAPGVTVGPDGIGETTVAEAAVVEAIRSAAPTIVLVGLGAPKQERWIARHGKSFPSVRVMIGVGGAFDMWAGRFPRAPRLLHVLGLEWLWRLALEPRRIRRILDAVVIFPLRAFLDRRS
jgi:N-acetylglucosaminyldiphosphoundecaprenol N-acetyl-beta-D-mannosaminyltransferase